MDNLALSSAFLHSEQPYKKRLETLLTGLRQKDGHALFPMDGLDNMEGIPKACHALQKAVYDIMGKEYTFLVSAPFQEPTIAIPLTLLEADEAQAKCVFEAIKNTFEKSVMVNLYKDELLAFAGKSDNHYVSVTHIGGPMPDDAPDYPDYNKYFIDLPSLPARVAGNISGKLNNILGKPYFQQYTMEGSGYVILYVKDDNIADLLQNPKLEAAQNALLALIPDAQKNWTDSSHLLQDQHKLGK